MAVGDIVGSCLNYTTVLLARSKLQAAAATAIGTSRRYWLLCCSFV